LHELGLILPKPPTPLGAYVEVNQVGSLLFLSGTLPIVDGKLAFTGRLGGNLSVLQGQEAARLAALNALALAHEHAGGLEQVKKLVKLTVLMVTTEQSPNMPRSAMAPQISSPSFSARRRDTCAWCTVCKACP